MDILEAGKLYQVNNVGSGCQLLTFSKQFFGNATESSSLGVSPYQVLDCLVQHVRHIEVTCEPSEELRNALYCERSALYLLQAVTHLTVHVEEVGYRYLLQKVGGGADRLDFTRCVPSKIISDNLVLSPGTSAQEVLRVLLSHIEYDVTLTKAKRKLLAGYLRKALFLHEVWGWRKKQDIFGNLSWDKPYAPVNEHKKNYHDVPFTPRSVELLQSGSDGYVVL